MDGMAAARRAPFGDNPVVGRRGARTQDQIVRAALTVFGAEGYHATRVELITESAGCSRPTFYQYFANKEDLFRQIAQEVGDDLIAMLGELHGVTPDRDGRDALRAWLADLVAYYRDFAPIFANFSTAARVDQALTTGSSVLTERFADALLGAVDPSPDWPTPRRRAGVITTMIIRAQALWPRMEPGLTQARFIDGLADMTHRAVHGPLRGVNVGADASRPRRPRKSAAVAGSIQADGRASGALLAAGREVFPERGLHAARVDDLVMAAGVSHGTFYRYFPNKDALFDVLITDSSRVLTELAAAFPAEGGDNLVREWGERWFDIHDRHGAIFTAWNEADPAEPSVAASMGRVARPIGAALSKALSRRGFGDPYTDAIALLALTERLPYTVTVLGQMTRREAVEELVAIVDTVFLGVSQPKSYNDVATTEGPLGGESHGG